MYNCANCSHLKLVSPIGVDLDDYVICELARAINCGTDSLKMSLTQAHLWGRECSDHTSRVKEGQPMDNYRVKVIECCGTCKFGRAIPSLLRLLAPGVELDEGYCTREQPDESTVDTWYTYVREWQVALNGYCDNYEETE